MASVEEDYEELFETKKARGRYIYRLFSGTIFICICYIWFYRLVNIQTTTYYSYSYSHVVNIGMLLCEFWFGFYWILTQPFRWNQVYRSTFKHALSRRYKAEELPGVDIFVCTADPKTEPPIIVINTVLSVMSYDYPPDKLTVYLSDDAGFDLTFYAFLQASSFANHWLPFCKKHKIEPRSPAAYFESNHSFLPFPCPQDLALVQSLYEEMKTRIDNAIQLGHISDEIRSTHTGFSQWKSTSSQRDHDTVLQIVSDGKDRDLPTLVYLAREKRPQHFHNYKAGSMNALLRVSSEISNGDIILNVDCDMYSNNSKSIRDALCFFMDEKQGQQIAYVQFPQNFNNTTNNDLYASALRIITEVDMHGLDGYGGPLYVGTGCFHRRDTLCGRKYNKEIKFEWNRHNSTRNTQVDQDTVKLLASATYDHNTLWGKEMGLRYGVPVEDVITGLSIQCQGWKSVYFNPERRGFLGIAPTTLTQSLVQHKRWSEGDFQILLSNYSPAWYGAGKISPGLQLGYCAYCLWAPNSLATLYYATIPALSLFHGISVFPKISSPWFLPFAYVIVAKYGYSLSEFLWSGGTVLGWWHEQRMWLYKRTSSYLFAVIDTILKKLGFSEYEFIITDKVTDEDVSWRYEQEMMEFGTSCSMFTMLAIVALLNMYCFIAAVGRTAGVFEEMGLQTFVCGIMVLINWPLYKAMFIRKDNGKMPRSLTIKASVIIIVALFASTWFSSSKQ